MARVFYQKHPPTSVGNVGINSVDTKSVYQKWQSDKTECFASVSREGLTRELLAKYHCLHLSWLFAFQSCARHMHHFAGCLVASYPRKLFYLQLLQSSHSLSLSITQSLQLNPNRNTGYKRLNKITIKFDTKLKPTKHIVVNYNFTIWKREQTLFHEVYLSLTLILLWFGWLVFFFFFFFGFFYFLGFYFLLAGIWLFVLSYLFDFINHKESCLSQIKRFDLIY